MRGALPLERERGVEKVENRRGFGRECVRLWVFFKACLFGVCVRARTCVRGLVS